MAGSVSTSRRPGTCFDIDRQPAPSREANTPPAFAPPVSLVTRGMSDFTTERLSSVHLEDMAFIILSTRASGQGFDLYPDIDVEMRSRLRSRIKQLSRYDWPSSVRDDPSFRRGYTLRQCCRLLVALLLLDAHLPPSLVVAMAQNNELTFLRAIAHRLSDPSRITSSPDDLIALIFPAEIRDSLAFPGRDALQAEWVRLLPRSDGAEIWSEPDPAAGARLLIDIPVAAAATWRWISGRRLLTDTARAALLVEVEERRSEEGYQRSAERRLRR